MFRIKTIGLAELLDGVLKSSGDPRAGAVVAAEKFQSHHARRCADFFAIVDDFPVAAR
jgi:hypothetical protein